MFICALQFGQRRTSFAFVAEPPIEIEIIWERVKGRPVAPQTEQRKDLLLSSAMSRLNLVVRHRQALTCTSASEDLLRESAAPLVSLGLYKGAIYITQ